LTLKLKKRVWHLRVGDENQRDEWIKSLCISCNMELEDVQWKEDNGVHVENSDQYLLDDKAAVKGYFVCGR